MAFRVKLDAARGVPVYRQIYEAVIHGSSTGALGRDEQLPTIHELAAELAINPNTVARAYRELERDGHVTARRGQGTFTADRKPVASEATRVRVLQGIYRRALREGAEHGIDAAQVVSYFRRALDDDA